MTMRSVSSSVITEAVLAVSSLTRANSPKLRPSPVAVNDEYCWYSTGKISSGERVNSNKGFNLIVTVQF